MGEEQLCLFDRTQEDWEQQGLSDGPMTVGIDGGYVRAAHKEGWFEVIAGKSVVAFRREAEDETPSAKCFGFVQTYDDKPRRRLWELMKSQGMKENQQVVFMSDGGEDRPAGFRSTFIRAASTFSTGFTSPCELPCSQQQTKALQAEQGQRSAEEVAKQLESVKHLLWHGNAEEALERLAELIIELDLNSGVSPRPKNSARVGEFETYIRNNQESIPNLR